MIRRHLVAVPLALGLVAGVPLAVAFGPEALAQAAATPRPRAFTEATVDIVAAIAAVRTAGYAAVRSAEWDDGAWEVKANDAQGRRIKLIVDPVSGAVTHAR